MFIATLIAPVRERALDGALVTSLRNALGGGEIRWLAPDEAAEFPLAQRPANETEIWAEVDALGIDLVIQPEAGRRKKLLIADMDSTMIRQECIDELAAEAGVGERVAAITARAMNGELDFEGALDARVTLLKGLPESIIDHVLATRISHMPGGFDLVATMKANGAHTALVSGGFTAFTSRVATALGFDENRANTLEVENGHLTGRVLRPVLGREAKLEALQQIAARLGITAEEALTVGDGMNDLLMLQAAGTGVALHGKPALQQLVKHRINHSDLVALLFIQGYARTDFVT